MPVITLKIPFKRKGKPMLSQTQISYLRTTAYQIMETANDPERFLTLYSIRVQRNENFQKPGEYRDAALANGWDKILDVYINLKAEAPDRLNIHGMRQYFNQISKGKSRDEFDVWLVVGLNAERTNNEAYKRFIEGDSYAPVTDAGKDRLKGIQKAKKKMEENKDKILGIFGIDRDAPKPAADFSELSQQLQALSIQMKLNHYELLVRLEDLELKI